MANLPEPVYDPDTRTANRQLTRDEQNRLDAGIPYRYPKHTHLARFDNRAATKVDLLRAQVPAQLTTNDTSDILVGAMGGGIIGTVLAVILALVQASHGIHSAGPALLIPALGALGAVAVGAGRALYGHDLAWIREWRPAGLTRDQKKAWARRGIEIQQTINGAAADLAWLSATEAGLRLFNPDDAETEILLADLRERIDVAERAWQHAETRKARFTQHTAGTFTALGSATTDIRPELFQQQRNHALISGLEHHLRGNAGLRAEALLYADTQDRSRT